MGLLQVARLMALRDSCSPLCGSSQGKPLGPGYDFIAYKSKEKNAYIDYLNSSRILANYDFAESHTVLINDILEHAHQEKENVPQKQLSRQTLGWIITDSFGGKVRVVQRGKRKHRERAYLNLRRRNLHESPFEGRSVSSESLPVSLKNMQLPNHWHYCIQDHDDQVSFIRHENWEFSGQWGITELLVKQGNPDNPDLVSLVVRAHGNSVDLNNEFGFTKLLGERTIENQILYALNYVDQSSLCFGFEDDANCVPSMLTHVAGVLRLANVESKRLFAHNCLVVSDPSQICNNCSRLRVQYGKRKRRKESQMEIHPKCNKRYMTKEELEMQLKSEQKARRNAEKREEYWREKFQKECVAVESEDQDDLFKIFSEVEEMDVPEEMKCFWQQQHKILHTKSKNGYRWHPK